jgi:hypothetical protein
MDVQTASAAPTAPLPVQTASALTASTPTAQTAQSAQGTPPVKIPPAAPPAPTASHVDATAAKPAPVAMATQVTSESPSVRVATTSSVEYPPAALAPDEMRLTKEIDHLWHAHSQAQGSLRQSREEAAKIRADLSMHLYQLKSVLSRPGRGGAWFSFLKARSIPRSTADRLAKTHEKTISGAAGNCPTGASEKHEPMEVVVRRYLHGLWPKLSQVLTSREHVGMFVTELTQMAEKSFGEDDKAASSKASDGADATL